MAELKAIYDFFTIFCYCAAIAKEGHSAVRLLIFDDILKDERAA